MIMKRFGIGIGVLLILTLFFCGTVFAFPRDPNPSAIDDTQFRGDWTNTLRSLGSGTAGIRAMRVLNFLAHEFNSEYGPGAPKDLQIWKTPSFTDDKVSADRSSWEQLKLNPGATVNEQYGRSMFTTHKEMIDFLESLPKGNMTLEYLGEIPRGFPFPFVIFSNESKPHTPEKIVNSGKPLVWVQGLIHGGEWSAGESTLATAYDLAYKTRHAYIPEGYLHAGDEILDHVNVILLPRICADGAKRPSRETYDLQALQWTPTPEPRDLNRDNMLFDVPVSRVVRNFNVAYKPHITVNLHERGNSTFTQSVLTTFGQLVDNDAGDIGASAANTLVLPKDFLELYYKYIVPDLQEFAPKYGVHLGFYREGVDTYSHGVLNHFNPGAGIESHTDAGYSSSLINNKAWDPDAPYMLISEAAYNTRNARNHNAMPGTISILFENKAGPTNVGNRGMWERRVATGYLSTLAAMISAATRPEFIGILNDMREKWIEKGKTVTADDQIPLRPVPPKPSWVDREWTVVDISGDFPITGEGAVSIDDFSNTTRYDWTRSLRRNTSGTGAILDGEYDPVKDNSGARSRQPFKLELLWQGHSIKNRVRPYAYLINGPFAGEIATRMLLSGIEVKRLASDVTLEVEAGHFDARTVFLNGAPNATDNASPGPYVDNAVSGSTGWLNRDATVFTAQRTFKKDETYVVYLAQVRIHSIPMYLELDFTWNAASCIYLPRMSVALGGAASRNLSEKLIGVEVPVYRYLKEVDLPTYDVDHFLPLINRGGVARFFNYQTQESVANIANALNITNDIKVFEYDIQLHTRTDALVNGRFDMALPTREGTEGYMIQKRDGTYEPLKPHTTMLGMNVATIIVANHGLNPRTVDLDSSGQPLVGDSSDGNYRVLPRPLPATDDLYGFRIVEILEEEDCDIIDKLLSGCNVVYGAFIALALLPLFVKRRKQ